MQLQNLMLSLQRLHQEVALDIWPNGAILRCKVCEHEIEANSNDCARYLKEGWPKCCSQGMLVENREAE